MKVWQKILVVFLGSGLCGAGAFCATIWPDFSLVFAGLTSACSAAMGIIVGWTPGDNT